MKYLSFFSLLVIFMSCSKSSDGPSTPGIPPTPFNLASLQVNGTNTGSNDYNNAAVNSQLKISFTAPVKSSSIAGKVLFNEISGAGVVFNATLENNDSTIVIRPASPLKHLTRHTFTISAGLLSTQDAVLQSPIQVKIFTTLDSTDKFAVLSDDALLTLVQEQTFKYFWDFAHPVSGLALERNTSGQTVTSGGSGFGIMAIVAGVSRNFKTRAEGLGRLQLIVSFLKNTAQKFHGAFPHWLNGATGAVVPFSAKDDGADLVETAYLIQGLLTARQYFNSGSAAETALRNDINAIWQGVEWSWFRQGNQNVLYWHWSPNFGWDMNVQIRGWNEALITYVLAASSPTFPVPKIVYDNGWAGNGTMRNNNTYFSYPLPLGPNLGGPLFFEHYSFLGINPFGLNDQYANYQVQAINHTRIQYEYSKANPRNYFGYSNLNWGLTASDIPGGYAASSPTNDIGVIAPTAALSSFPYTPVESMQALKFFYYKLGDKLWGSYGFKDAFSLHTPWFADSYLAIDQGPIIIMIENHRTGLLWNLFTSTPEVKTGMLGLGFTAPYL